jgi:FdhD protein
MVMRPGRRTAKIEIQRADHGQVQLQRDLVAVEEPLEIRLHYEDEPGRLAEQSLSITMRTPGDDFELAAGFLFSEGIIQTRDQIQQISYCVGPAKEKQEYNVISVELRSGVRFDRERLLRHFYTTSSCGVCGKASLAALEVRGCSRLPEGLLVSPERISRLPEALHSAQAVFEKTGGLHAAALFDADGRLVSLREDVGRHNAVDKLIGERLLAGRVPLHRFLMLVSGRASFEIMQKALVAGIPIVAAVGAPSSLAVDLASEFNMTLLGFVRGETFNIYTGAQRVAS